MYSVGSDPLPWERLRTGVQGPDATEEGRRRRRSPMRERKRRGRSRCGLGEVEDRSSRVGGDRGRPVASVKSAAAAVARARERKKQREEEVAGTGFKYELVVQSDWHD
jgi:hypothetical protein